MKNNNRMRTISIWMERFWLAVAVVSLVAVAYFFITEGVNGRTLQYLIFPLLAGIMYGFRVTFRKRFEGRDQ